MKNLKNLKSSYPFQGSFISKPLFYFSKIDPSKDWYKILQVDKNATPEDIKKSYYSLAKKYHPDVNKGSDDNFKDINLAYEILSDDQKRKKFDQYLAGDTSTQNIYNNYHYGYNTRQKSKYNSDWQKQYQRKNEDFYSRANYSDYRRDYEQGKYNDFYRSFNENMSPKYEDYDTGKQEYDRFLRKMMFYPLLFLLIYSLIFFLPSRNMSKEFVLYDENTGKVFVVDKNQYEEIKRRSLKNINHLPSKLSPQNLYSPQYNHSLKKLD